LRRQLANAGIARERHAMASLAEMLPIRLDGKPYQDFDVDIVAEVLIYLIGKGLIAVPGPALAELNLRWGERVCHFYRSEEELLLLLLPYFRQGLADGERCVWLTRDDAGSDKARQAIAALADSQYSPDQLELTDAQEWSNDLDAWTREEQHALDQGYHGVRVCGEALTLEDRTAALRIKALCTYSARRTDRAVLPIIIRSHHAALVKNREYWQRIPMTDAAAAQTILSALMS
jgi:DcmR-like sensory protein